MIVTKIAISLVAFVSPSLEFLGSHYFAIGE